jgi:hypothetical protein
MVLYNTAGTIRNSGTEAEQMEKPFSACEPIADGPLAEIPRIFKTGRIPDELLPKTAEDRAAISALQSRIWPIDDS